MLDLLLPLSCGGCGAPSTRWCLSCEQAFAAEPTVITPRVDPGVPVFSLGRHVGPRRQAIVAMKERGRRDLTGYLGISLTVGVEHLLRWQMIGPPLALVPAPSRWTSARARGGDPVTALARVVALLPDVCVVPLLTMRAGVRDSVGLSVADRQRNVAGRIAVRRGRRGVHPPETELLLVDDVVTTGATAAESVRALRAAGLAVAAVLTLTYA